MGYQVFFEQNSMIGPFDRPGRLAAQRGTRGHVPCQARGLGSRAAKPSGGGIANALGFGRKRRDQLSQARQALAGGGCSIFSLLFKKQQSV